MPSTEKRTCFVICPIGEEGSDNRKRSDKVLKHIFRKALADKYEVTRGDEIDEPGMITSQVLRAVQDADLVVADLTGHNPNVFYELAVRHAMEKPIIHLIDPRLSKIPFDCRGLSNNRVRSHRSRQYRERGRTTEKTSQPSRVREVGRDSP
jgi:hypothetical protein